jgi:nitroreductase
LEVNTVSALLPDPGLVRNAVSVASRAPSLHNTQPWQWIADGRRLELHLDRSRVVRNTDTGGREAVIGCGAVLDHLRAAMAAAGWACDVRRFPDHGDPAHLATVEFSRSPGVTDAQRRTVDAIMRRRTDRLPFLAPPSWATLEPVLRDAVTTVAGGTVCLDVLADELRPELAAASSLTERAQRFNTGYQAELDWWTAPFDYAEGIPRSALTSAIESDRVKLNRSFPVEGHGARRAGIGDDGARVVILSTPCDTYRDALACGEALSAVLLECTGAGLATCPVTHVTELPSARSVVGELIREHGIPQVLVRVRRIPEIEDAAIMTPRRDVDEILRFAGS